MTASEIRGHLSMFAANVIWGLMSPFAKMVIVGGIVAPLPMTFMRIAGAMALFWLTSLFRPRETVPPADLLRLAGAAMLGIVLNQGCFIFGVGMTSPADASIITTSMPLWAMILAAFILKEPITAKKIGGIVCGAAGAILLIGGNSPSAPTDGNHLLGDLLVLGAQLSYATYLVVYKRFVSRYSMVTVMKWMFTFAFLFVLPFSVDDLASTQWLRLDLIQIAALAFIVVGATYLSYSLVVAGQRNLRPTVAGMYNYIQPTVACAVAVALGMDRFTPVKFLSIALIFTGVWLVSRSRSASQTHPAARPIRSEIP